MQVDVSILAKDLPHAKQRLRCRLGRHGAIRFAGFCLRRVIAAAQSLQHIHRVRVVTNGPVTAAVATAAEASVWYQRDPGLAAAAREALALHPDVTRLLLMADLPLLTADDLAALCDAANHSEITFLPDRHQRGINGFVLAPGVAYDPELGHGDGFLRNRERAEHLHLAWQSYLRTGLAHDCDTEADYEAFLAAHRT